MVWLGSCKKAGIFGARPYYLNIVKTHTIHKGDKIAQIELCKLEDFAIDVVDTLADTDRGEGGFGSTDKK